MTIVSSESSSPPKLKQKSTLYIRERTSSQLKNGGGGPINSRIRKDDSMLEVNEGDEIEENIIGITSEILSPATRPDPEVSSTYVAGDKSSKKQSDAKSIKLIVLTNSDDGEKNT